MDGPKGLGVASGRALPEMFGEGWSGVHVSSTSNPPVRPVLSTVNRLTNGAKLVASCVIGIALPNRAPGPILVAQFGVRPGTGRSRGPAKYAAQSTADLLNCGPSF